MRKRLFWLLCVLVTVCCGATALAAAKTTAASTEYSLGEVYAKVSIVDTYIVLQKGNLAQHPELMASRNTTEEETLADWEARGVLLQAWTPELDACMEIRAQQDEDATNYFDINAQTDQARKTWRTSLLKGKYADQGYDMKSAEWTKSAEGVRFLRLKYKRTVNGLVTWGYMDRTIQNGWSVILDYQVFGRGVRDRDLNSLKKMTRTVSFTQTQEIPETTQGTLTFSATPPAETNVSTFTVEGVANPGAHLIGTVMKQANSVTTPRRVEADANSKSGKFKMNIKLDEEGVWLVTLTVEKDGTEIAWHVFEPTVYRSAMLPVNMDAEVPEQFDSDEYVLSGKTSKGVSVQCIVSGGAKPYDKSARTNNSGKFSFKIPTDTQSEYNITLVFQKKNYETRRFTWTANRTLTERDIQNQYRAQAVRPAYTTLKRKLEAYTGRIMGYQVTISDIQEADGEYLVFAALTKTKKGALKDIVVVTTDEKPNFVAGSQQTFYGRLKGTYEVQNEEDVDAYPEFELLFWE